MDSKYKMLLTDVFKFKSKQSIAILLSLFITSCGVISPLIIQRIIDDGIIKKSINNLIAYIILAIVLSLIEGCFIFIVNMIYQEIKKQYCITTKTKLLKSLSLKSGDYLTNISTGKLINILSIDVDNISDLITDNIYNILRDIITSVVVLIIMIKMNWKIFIFVALVQVVLLIVSVKYSTPINKVLSMI